MQADAEAGSATLIDAYASTGEVDALMALQRFVIEQQPRLAQLAEAVASRVVRGRVEDMLEFLRVHPRRSGVSDQAKCYSCSSGSRIRAVEWPNIPNRWRWHEAVGWFWCRSGTTAASTSRR